jgi:hypothetical protein
MGRQDAPSHIHKDVTRVAYIGGCGRSGSTLLDRLLGQVPGLCSVGELVHIWRRGLVDGQLCGCGEPFPACAFWSKVGEIAFGGWDGVDAAEMLRLQRRVDRNRYIPLMILPRLWPAYGRRMRAYASRLGRLYQAIAEAAGGQIVVDSTKHASTAFLLRRVEGIELRVIHLVRDPRGVAYSWTKQVRKPEVPDRDEYMPRYHPVRMAARWLVYNLLFHLHRWMGTPSVFLRYESLIDDPAGEVRRVLGAVGARSAPERLGFIDGSQVTLAPSHSVAGNPMRFREGSLPLRVDAAWRRAMEPRQQRAVALLTWPLMRRYGYRLRDVQVEMSR